MFCANNTPPALKLFCSVVCPGSLFVFDTQGVMTSRIVICQVPSKTPSDWAVSLSTCAVHSNWCQWTTAPGNEKIGYYAKPFLSCVSIQTNNNFHIMPHFKKTLKQVGPKDGIRGAFVFTAFQWRACKVLTLICGSTGCHHWSLPAGPASSR